mmetsp:Transcript_13357/g.34039  ORF Transcript_13357/g.34039 Transcript_13357/m.34039 type:complete len:291 (+) Transcript_13357:115-987(+)
MRHGSLGGRGHLRERLQRINFCICKINLLSVWEISRRKNAIPAKPLFSFHRFRDNTLHSPSDNHRLFPPLFMVRDGARGRRFAIFFMRQYFQEQGDVTGAVREKFDERIWASLCLAIVHVGPRFKGQPHIFHENGCVLAWLVGLLQLFSCFQNFELCNFSRVVCLNLLQLNVNVLELERRPTKSLKESFHLTQLARVARDEVDDIANPPLCHVWIFTFRNFFLQNRFNSNRNNELPPVIQAHQISHSGCTKVGLKVGSHLVGPGCHALAAAGGLPQNIRYSLVRHLGCQV